MKNLFKLLGIALLIGAIGFALGACSSPAGGPPNDGLEGAGTAAVDFGEAGEGTVTIGISPDYTFELVITEGSANDANTITQTGTYTINEDNTLTLIDEDGTPVGKATIKDGKVNLEFDDELGGGYGGWDCNFDYEGTEPIEEEDEGGGPGSGPDVIAGLDAELVGKWFMYTKNVDADDWIFEVTAAGQLISDALTQGPLNITTSGGKISTSVTTAGQTVTSTVEYDINGDALSFGNQTTNGYSSPSGLFTPFKAALDFAQATIDASPVPLDMGFDGYYHKDVVTSDPGSDPGDEPGDDPGSDPGDGGTGGVNPGPGGSGSTPATAKFDGKWKGTVKVDGRNYDAYITFTEGFWTGQVSIPNDNDMMMENGIYISNLTGNGAALMMGGEVLGQVSLKNSRLTITLNNTTPVPGTYTFTPFNGTIPEDTGPGGGTSIEGNWKGSVPGFGDVYSTVEDGHWSVYPMGMEGTYTWNGTTATLKDEDGYTVGTARLQGGDMVITITVNGQNMNLTFTRYTGAMPGGEINPDGPPVIEGTWKGTMPEYGDVYTTVEDDTWYVSPFDMGGTYTWNGTTATLRDEDGNTVGTAMLQGNNTMVIKITAPGSPISSITLTRSNEVIPGGDSPVKLMEGNWHGTMLGMGDLYVNVTVDTWYLSPFGMSGTFIQSGSNIFTLRDELSNTVGTATFNQGNDTMVIIISSMGVPPITLTRYYGEIPGGGVIPGGDYPGVIPGGNYPDGNYPGSLGF